MKKAENNIVYKGSMPAPPPIDKRKILLIGSGVLGALVVLLLVGILIYSKVTAPVPPPSDLEFTSGGIGKCYVSGIGDYTDTELVIPEVAPDGKRVIGIADRAFFRCVNLTSVTIPASVTSIGDGAFLECTALSSVTFSDSVITIGEKAFYRCESLSSVTIPDSVTSIGVSAFNSCGAMVSATVPASVTSIGRFALSGNASMTIYCGAASKPSGWDDYWNYSGSPVVWSCESNAAATDGFIYTVVDGIRYALKDGEATVARQALNLTTAEIRGSVAYGGVDYPVTGIADSAFYACGRLASVTIPASVTSIGYEAFSTCTVLSSITLPATVTNVGERAFSGSYALSVLCEAASKPSGFHKDWASHVGAVIWDFENNDVAADGCIYVTVDGIRYAIKDGRATVAKQPTDLTSADIAPSITYGGTDYPVTGIQGSAFQGCSMLSRVIIPDSVRSIGMLAFTGCDSLCKITIPTSVTSITEEAFGCNALTIYCEAASKPSGWDNYWNEYHCPVVWDARNNDVASDSMIYTVVDGIRYGLRNGEATVMRQPKNMTVANIPETVRYRGVEYPVTAIGAFAFANGTSLSSVTIPPSVTSIEQYAFYEKTALASITIPATVTEISEHGVSFSVGNLPTVYCEVKKMPKGWSSSWNSAECPVVWGAR